MAAVADRTSRERLLAAALAFVFIATVVGAAAGAWIGNQFELTKTEDIASIPDTAWFQGLFSGMLLGFMLSGAAAYLLAVAFLQPRTTARSDQVPRE